MVKTLSLYQVASAEDIPILLDIPENSSMCIQTEARGCYIGMDHDTLNDEASCRIHLAHELGHCETGAFYKLWAACDLRQNHENLANKRAISAIQPPPVRNSGPNMGKCKPEETENLYAGRSCAR